VKIILGKGQFLGPISGADETLVAYATQLQLAGHSVSVLLMYPHAPDDQYYIRLREAGVPVSSIAPAHVHTSLDAGRRLARGLLQVFPPSRHVVRRRAQKIATSVAARYYNQCCDYLKQSRADLIHVITPDPSAMVMIRAARDSGLPVFYQELGTPYHPPDFESYYEQFTSVLPLCSEVAALSPQLAEQCREKLPFTNSLSVLPVMTDDLFNGATARDLRLNASGVTFGFAARLEPLKGPLILMDACAAICLRFADIKLRVAGAGSQKRKMIERAETLGIAGRCDFPGVYTRPEEKSAFMQSLDVFVLPSLTEGTPNCIVEAMAHGRPVISTTVGGIPDVVTPDTGILVPPEDATALAHAMSRLAEDPDLRARMGRAAKERYEKLFSPCAVLPLMLNTYERVAARSNNRTAIASPNGNGLLHPWAHNGC
jgi:glycosyltransferase involved in cell wall biosynthesis